MSEGILIGRNPIFEALKSGRDIERILISNQLNQNTERDLRQQAKKRNITIQQVPKQRLDQLSQERHQGMIAYVAQYDYMTVDEILHRAVKKDEQPFLIILDELEDPYNLGAVLRTADATGVHGVIIPKRRAVGLTDAVAKVSAGAIEHVPVARVTNIVQTIKRLKEENIWIVGTDEAGAEDYRTLDGQTAIALIIGNEGRGISRLVKENCDWTVKIPMKGNIPSLNASVASSLLMYEIYRKRTPLGDV